MPQNHLGPPYANFERFRDYPERGAWSAATVNGDTGKIDLQMNAEPPSPGGDLFAAAGLEDQIEIETGGNYLFVASVHVSAVTLQPHGQMVTAEIAMEIGGIASARKEFNPPRGAIGVDYGTETLAFPISLQPGTYTLRLACGLLMSYTGTPNPVPHAAISATYNRVTVTQPETPGHAATRSFRERGAATKRVILKRTDADLGPPLDSE